MVECERLPLVPETIFDSRHRPVGRIDELIGPWKGPLARVRLERGVDTKRLLGQKVFTGD